jgi:hypothetical protein
MFWELIAKFKELSAKKRLMWFLIIVAAIIMAVAIVGNARAGEVTLAWDANTETDLAGYKIYWSTTVAGGPYPNKVDVGKVTQYIVKNLPDGTYWFVATAYDTAGNESAYSNEVSVRIDGTAPMKPNQLRVIKVVVQNGQITTTVETLARR